jgi:hypothetical protein
VPRIDAPDLGVGPEQLEECDGCGQMVQPYARVTWDDGRQAWLCGECLQAMADARLVITVTGEVDHQSASTQTPSPEGG